jgi:hypothetical protein
MTREERYKLMSLDARFNRKRSRILKMLSVDKELAEIGRTRFKYFVERKRFWKKANNSNFYGTDNDSYNFVRGLYDL